VQGRSRKNVGMASDLQFTFVDTSLSGMWEGSMLRWQTILDLSARKRSSQIYNMHQVSGTSMAWIWGFRPSRIIVATLLECRFQLN
jgi:hypothetical protein